MRAKKPLKKKPIPYEFVIEELVSHSPLLKPMFGCQALYIEEKIILILRDKETETDSNGIWIATVPEHHEGLRREFARMESIPLFGPGVTGWQMLPAASPSLEEDAFKLCALIKARDPRVGKTVKKRKSAASGRLRGT